LANLNHYLFNFSAAPVVALHGWASYSHQWKSLIGYLEDRFKVIALDLPGYGPGLVASNRPGLAGDADPIIQEIERLGDPVHLVGHSYGGAVAMKIALLRPDLLLSLTVYEPVMFSLLSGSGPRYTNMFGEVVAVASNLQNAIITGEPKTGMQGFFDFWNGIGSWNSLPDSKKERLAAVACEVNKNFGRAFEERTGFADLATIEVSTMMMVGMESPVATQQLGGMIARAIPNTKLAMLPCLGHMAPIDASEWVNPRILHHISEVEQCRVTGVNAIRWVA
jgi:pimeloyl-ACP methyl ester carboxylesterase